MTTLGDKSPEQFLQMLSERFEISERLDLTGRVGERVDLTGRGKGMPGARSRPGPCASNGPIVLSSEGSGVSGVSNGSGGISVSGMDRARGSYFSDGVGCVAMADNDSNSSSSSSSSVAAAVDVGGSNAGDVCSNIDLVEATVTASSGNSNSNSNNHSSGPRCSAGGAPRLENRLDLDHLRDPSPIEEHHLSMYFQVINLSSMDN